MNKQINQRLLTLHKPKIKNMKKLILALSLLSLAACKKEKNDPPVSVTHSLTVTNANSVTFKLYINNILQPFGATSFTVKTGDVIYAVDNGQDTTTLNPDGTVKSHNEGNVYVVVFIDNIEKYNKQCACDAVFNYTI